MTREINLTKDMGTNYIYESTNEYYNDGLLEIGTIRDICESKLDLKENDDLVIKISSSDLFLESSIKTLFGCALFGVKLPNYSVYVDNGIGRKLCHKANDDTFYL